MTISSRRIAGRSAVRLLLILALLGMVLAFLVVAARRYIEVDEVQLPNLVGMSITEASGILADLDLEPIAYAEYIRAAQVDEVTSQTPAAGTVVRRGRTISLGVHTPPSQERAPVLIGLTADEALALAREMNLNLGRIEYAHNDVPAGIVISQTPEPGNPVTEPDGLRVTVSRGPELPPVAVPDVRGLMLDEAEERLRSMGFVSVSRVAVGTTQARPGSVIEQQPEPGNVVDRSTQVFLGYGLAANVVVQVPTVRGELASTAQIRLRSAGLLPASVEYVNDTSLARGAVVSTVPAAGSYTLANTPVHLVVNDADGSVDILGQPLPPSQPQTPPRQAGDAEPLFPPGELGGRTVPFSFDPAAQGIPSLLDQRYDLRVVVEDERGTRDVLERNMPAGEGLATDITVYGDALLQMYINEVFFMAWRP